MFACFNNAISIYQDTISVPGFQNITPDMFREKRGEKNNIFVQIGKPVKIIIK